MQPSPRVRVVVVNWNRRDLTLRCLDSVAKLDWPQNALDVVVVDNGSTDGSTEAIRQQHPDIHVVESGANLGFAAGCNLGMGHLDGIDYVALLNNDAEAEPGWLRELVAAFERQDRVGAATSKVLFADSFVSIDIEASLGPILVDDRRQGGVLVSDAQVDGVSVWSAAQFRSGWLGELTSLRGTRRWTGAGATVLLPVTGPGPWSVRLALTAGTRRRVVLRSNADELEAHVEPGNVSWHEVTASGPPVDLVDNAGSVLGRDLYGRDRGHLADPAAVAEKQEVFAWYGGAALLSTDYLRDVGRFDERLFMYYEDLDLSWRGRARGWRYVYVPTALVRHQHSASAVEGSDFAEYHGERNRLLVVARNAPAALALRATARFLMSTASYARRDLLLLRKGHRSAVKVSRRMRSFGGFLRRLPPVLGDRARERRVPRAELECWLDR